MRLLRRFAPRNDKVDFWAPDNNVLGSALRCDGKKFVLLGVWGIMGGDARILCVHTDEQAERDAVRGNDG